VHEPGDVANNKNAHQKNPIEMNREFPVNLDGTDRIVTIGVALVAFCKAAVAEWAADIFGS